MQFYVKRPRAFYVTWTGRYKNFYSITINTST